VSGGGLDRRAGQGPILPWLDSATEMTGLKHPNSSSVRRPGRKTQSTRSDEGGRDPLRVRGEVRLEHDFEFGYPCAVDPELGSPGQLCDVK
jgi:hypothetical protein